MASKLLINIRNTFIVAMIMAWAGYIAYEWKHHQGVQTLRDEAETRLSVVSANLLAPAGKYSYLPGIIAAHPSTIQILLDKHNPATVHAGNLFLQQLNTDARLAVVYLIDHTGLTIAASNWQEQKTFIGHNYSYRPYFQDALKDGVGKFYAMGTISLVPGYYLSSAVKKDGVVLGVLAIKINMDKLDFIQHTNDAEVSVTDENGIAFLSTLESWKYRPIIPLSAEVEKKVKSTRQYEGVLKSVLPASVKKTLDSDEKIINIAQADAGAEDNQWTQYLMRSGQFPGSPWMVHVFVPMKPVNLAALRFAVLTVVMLGLFLLAMMYLLETRSRIGERERSSRALQDAHQALEQQHKELEALSEDLRIVSITDSLTGAYNRRYFLDVVGKLANAVNHPGYALSIMMIDVDYFKRINDVYGHPTGDKVLQLLTAACKEILRADDVFARFGGEEFIVAFPDTDEHAARQLAERLRSNIMERAFEVNGQVLALTVSCGISRYRFTETGMDETIKRADEALYEAKSSGRNRVVVFV